VGARRKHAIKLSSKFLEKGVNFGNLRESHANRREVEREKNSLRFYCIPCSNTEGGGKTVTRT